MNYGMNDNYNMDGIDLRASNNFLRKVFLYMIFGVALSFGTGIYLYVYNQPLLVTAINNYTFLVIAQVAVVLALSFLINKISLAITKLLFFAYSILTGVTLTAVGFVYEPLTIVYAFTITLVIFVVTAIFGYTTKEDLSSYRRFFLIGLISLIIMGLINAFFRVPALYWLETIVGVVIFTGLIAYDVNRIKHMAYYITDGDSEIIEKIGIIGAFNLYLDFINLFLYVLRFFGRKK